MTGRETGNSVPVVTEHANTRLYRVARWLWDRVEDDKPLPRPLRWIEDWAEDYLFTARWRR